MDKQLHLLDTFSVRGSDDKRYVVRGYEHLSRLAGVLDMVDRWEATGELEYRLDDGRSVSMDHSGAMRVTGTDIALTRDTFVPRKPS